MLDEQTGIIIENGKEHELAENAIYLLQSKQTRIQMGHLAFQKTRDTVWKKVAIKHTGLFEKILNRPFLKAATQKQLIN